MFRLFSLALVCVCALVLGNVYGEAEANPCLGGGNDGGAAIVLDHAFSSGGCNVGGNGTFSITNTSYSLNKIILKARGPIGCAPWIYFGAAMYPSSEYISGANWSSPLVTGACSGALPTGYYTVWAELTVNTDNPSVPFRTFFSNNIQVIVTPE